jgi:hypothetical protein
MRKKIIAGTVAFALLSALACKEGETKREEQPSCVSIDLKSGAPDSQVRPRDCKS